LQGTARLAGLRLSEGRHRHLHRQLRDPQGRDQRRGGPRVHQLDDAAGEHRRRLQLRQVPHRHRRLRAVHGEGPVRRPCHQHPAGQARAPAPVQAVLAQGPVAAHQGLDQAEEISAWLPSPIGRGAGAARVGVRVLRPSPEPSRQEYSSSHLTHPCESGEPLMLTIYSDDPHLHHGKFELIDGQLTPCFEKPSRADMVLARARKVKLGEVIEPREFGLEPILRVHDEGFVHFLKGAWAEWQALGRDHDMLPFTWPNRRLRQTIPDSIDGRLGYYSFDAGVPITAGSWQAISSSVNVAMTGQAELARGARGVFSLCRPPGHHASADYMGGYCYLNNA